MLMDGPGGKGNDRSWSLFDSADISVWEVVVYEFGFVGPCWGPRTWQRIRDFVFGDLEM